MLFRSPYFLSSAISPRRVDNILKDNMNKLSQDRGIFLELPIFDLEDTKTLSSMSVLNSPNEYISSKYNYDNLIQIKITNSGLGEWVISGDINKSFIGNNFYQDLEEVFLQFLIKLIDQNLNDLAIVTSKNSELIVILFFRVSHPIENLILDKQKTLKHMVVSSISFQISLLLYTNSSFLQKSDRYYLDFLEVLPYKIEVLKPVIRLIKL